MNTLSPGLEPRIADRNPPPIATAAINSALAPAALDLVDATVAERGKVYGSPSASHANIGLSWTGLIQQHYGLTLDHPLPDWLVELMMVTFKCQRSARVYQADNFVDAHAYLNFAETDQARATP